MSDKLELTAKKLVDEWFGKYWDCGGCELHAENELVEIIQQALITAWDQSDFDNNILGEYTNRYKKELDEFNRGEM